MTLKLIKNLTSKTLLIPKLPPILTVNLYKKIDVRPVTTAGKGMRIGRTEYLPQRRVVNPRKEMKRTHNLNPSIQYVFSFKYRPRRLLTAGKLRSNTMLSHTKPQNIQFETGLDAEFLNLFAKD